ncbi:MAG: DUF4238 domain-containing protein [Isosphaeraceae bacterium]
MPSAKNHHFVPQFYLRNFSPDGRFIYVFDKITKRTSRPGIKSTACEPAFYDVPPEFVVTGNPQAMEDVLSAFESKHAEAMRGLLEEVQKTGSFTPGPSDRNQILAHFLIIQASRTREFRDSFTAMMHKAIAFGEDIFAAARNSRMEESGVIELEIPIMPYRPEMSSLDHAKFLLNPEFASGVIRILFDHIWLIGENQTLQPLYTSDAPVIRYSHNPSPHYGGAGFGSPGVEILLPLTSKFILILLERSWFSPKVKLPDGTVMRLMPEEVTRYNALQVLDSYRQVYCKTNQLDLASELVEK